MMATGKREADELCILEVTVNSVGMALMSCRRLETRELGAESQQKG